MAKVVILREMRDASDAICEAAMARVTRNACQSVDVVAVLSTFTSTLVEKCEPRNAKYSQSHRSARHFAR
jgi:hypothetical protein